MEQHRFDDLTRAVAGRTSRRRVLRGLGGAALAGLTAATRAPVAARQVSPGATPAGWGAVEALIADAEATGGVIGVAVHGAGGELFAHNGHRRFHAASTIKVPILIEAWRQVERGDLSLDEVHALRDEDRVGGSGVLGNLHAGLEITLADLLYLMITVSDNTATNLVIDRVGMDAVNATMASLGMANSVLGRKILGHLPAPGDPENWAAPSDFGVAMQAIVADEAASAESCARMREILARQEDVRRISRFLPDDGGLRWGSKPGDLPGAVNDVGYVTSDRGTLCVAAYCENLPDLDTAERAIGLIALEALAVTGIASFGPERSS